MHILFMAIIMAVSVSTGLMYISPTLLRRIMGYKATFNIALHITTIYLFINTSGEALIAAECSAIMLSLWIWFYSKFIGFERRVPVPRYKTTKGGLVQLPSKWWHKHEWVYFPGSASWWVKPPKDKS